MGVVAIDTVVAKGHAMVRASHRSTFEITKDSYLTPRGDCIIALESSKGVGDLSQELRCAISSDEAIVVLELVCNGIKDVVVCRGSRRLRLRDKQRIVVRRSRYVDDATLCIESNKAARDLDRRLISELQRGGTLIAKIIVVRAWGFEDRWGVRW